MEGRGEGDKRVSGHHLQHCCGIPGTAKESTIPCVWHRGDALVLLSRLHPPLFSSTSPHFPRLGVQRPLLQSSSAHCQLAATHRMKTKNHRTLSQLSFPAIFSNLESPHPLSPPPGILLALSQTTPLGLQHPSEMRDPNLVFGVQVLPSFTQGCKAAPFHQRFL